MLIYYFTKGMDKIERFDLTYSRYIFKYYESFNI